jgi:hypothetical protein
MVSWHEQRCQGLLGLSVQLDPGPDDNAVRAACPNKQLFPIDAAIVFAQAAEIREQSGLLVDQHDLKAEKIALHIAEAKQPGAPGIRGNHPSDTRVSAKIDGEDEIIGSGSCVDDA